MKVVVTGAAGFLGPHFSDAVAQAGHSAVGVDNPSMDSMENVLQPATRTPSGQVTRGRMRPTAPESLADLGGHPWTVAVIAGTRPEVIKLWPVYRALARTEDFEPVLILSGQHPDLARQTAEELGMAPSFELSLGNPSGLLDRTLAALIDALGAVLDQLHPHGVIVQGDTSTTLAGALAAAYRQVPVGHVEAGMRSGNRFRPFPEEMNRRLVSELATWHFAPTPGARLALLREGHSPSDVFMCGSTELEAVRAIVDGGLLEETNATDADFLSQGDGILVTMHRRENDASLPRVLAALRTFLDRHPSARVMLPVHPRPDLESMVRRELGFVERVRLTPPVPFRRFLACIASARIVVTDSGGIQEECIALGRPIVIVRTETEWAEILPKDSARVAKPTYDALLTALEELWLVEHTRMPITDTSQPASDGIVEHLRQGLAEMQHGPTM